MSIDDLSPAAVYEVQEFYLLKDTKQRDFRASGQPERRGKKRGNNWLRPWRENSQQWRWNRRGGSFGS